MLCLGIVRRENMNTYLKILVSMLIFCVFFYAGFHTGTELARTMKEIKTISTPSALPQMHIHYTKCTDTERSRGSKLEIDTSEKYCMAQNIYFEAANQSALGKLAVGLVVKNRVKDSKYPNTICEVVSQKSQFSWVDDNRSNEPKNDAAWKESLRIADDVMSGRADFLKFDGVMNYHADYVNPHWSGDMKEVATIDQHIFYRR
jgi:spore germination cell wall hydrolase CwlJ-like protein